MGFYDRLSNVQNVGPGSIAIVNFPVNVTYDKIKLLLGGGLAVADITSIEILADGKTIFKDTGPRALLRQKYKSQHTDTSFLTLDFTEPLTRGGPVSQYMASIPANLLKNMTMEVTIDAGAAAGSTMEVHTEFRGPTKNQFIRKMVDFNYSFPNAGEHDMFLPAGAVGGLIKRLWLHGTDKITEIDLRINRRSVNRSRKVEWEYVQKENELVPQAGMDVIDFIADGNMQGALNTASDRQGKAPTVEMRVTTSGAEAVTGYIEYVDPIGRL